MRHFSLPSGRKLMRWLGSALLAGGLTGPALAQPGYLALDALVVPGTYQDLGTTGTTITVANPDDANSAPQPIGFTFPYAGQTFTQFIFNTNGFIKLGTAAPSSAALYLTHPQNYTGPGVFASQDPADELIISPFNYDLEPGTGGPVSFRVATTGTAPNRVCTIQWKNVRDKSLTAGTAGTLYPTQYDNFEFQVKLYETTRQIDFVYGAAVPSVNPIGFRGAGCGLKGVFGSVPLTVTKSSATAWTAPQFRDANYSGNRFNFKKDVVPAPGVTYRFPSDACPRPANLNATVTGTTAVLTFSGVTGAQQYEVVYGPLGTVPGGPGAIALPPVAGTTAAITGITPGVSYVAYVRTNCGGGLVGAYAGPVFFCQVGTITSLPYVENFDGVSGGNRLPCGITIENRNGDTARWRNLRVNTLAASQPNAMRIETRTSGGPAKDDWFFLPGIQMTAGLSYDLSFKYRVGSTTSPERLEVKVGSAPTGASADAGDLIFRDTLITRGTFTNAPLGTGTFTAPSTGVFYFGFHAYSRPGRYRLYVDDVRVEPGPACPPVRNLNVASISATSAIVTFTAPAGNTYTVKYGPPGFNPATSGTSVTTSIGSANLTGLTQLTSYDVYVIRNCGAPGFSAPAGPVSFTTRCVIPTITALPWTENFDSTPAGRLPCGWATENGNRDTVEWRNRRANLSARSSPNALAIRWNPNLAMDDWAYSPGIQLQAGQNYEVNFYYRVGAASSPERLDVKVGNGPVANTMTIPLFTGSNLINTIYQQATATFAVPTTGVYYLGFHGYSDANKLRIFVDDVSLSLGANCPVATNLLVPATTATTATLAFTPAPGATGYQVIYGPTGFNPATGGTTVATTSPNATIAGLTALTGYQYYVRTTCGGGLNSALAGPRAFSTLCPPPTLTAPLTENFDATPVNTLPCGWTVLNVNGDTARWRVLNLATLTNSPPNGVRIDSDTPKDDWLVSPAIQLFAGVTYDLSFETRTGGAPEALAVHLATAASASALSLGEQIFLDTALTAISFPNPVSGQFTPTTTGLYYLGWHAFTGLDANRLYLDDIVLTPGTECPTPTGLAVNGVTGTSATASVATAAGSTFSFIYGPTGFNPTTGGTTVAASAGGTATLTGLMPGTAYQLYVLGACAGGAPTQAGPVAFTTLSPCPAASNLNASSITTTGAMLGFTPDPGSSYQVIYGLTGFNPATSGTTVPATGSGAVVTGLTPGTTYQFYVLATCAGGQATLVGPASFTTSSACAAPTGLAVSNVTATGATVSVSAAAGVTYQVIYGAPGFNPATGGTTVAAPGGAATLAGLTAATTYDAYVRATCPGGATSQVGPISFTTVSPCATPTGLAVTSVTTTGATVSVMAVTGVTYEVIYGAPGFNPATSGTTVAAPGGSVALAGLTNGTAYAAYIRATCPGGATSLAGPVSFTTLVPCAAPTGLTLTNVTTTGATVGVMAVAGVTYQVIYGAPGFNPATGGTTVAAPGGTVTLTGLTSTTAYEVYVRATCSGGSTSLAGPVSFTTATPCGVPTGLAVTNVTANGATVSVTAVAGVTYQVIYGAPGFNPATSGTTVTAPGGTITLVGLTTGTTYDVYVRATCPSGTTSQAGPVIFNTPSPCAAPTGLVVANVTPTGATVSVTAVPGVTYQVIYGATGFNPATSGTSVAAPAGTANLTGLTGSTGYDAYVRATCPGGATSQVGPVSFTTVSACAVPTNLSTSNVTATSAAITFTPGTGPSAFTVIYGPTGFNPATAGTSVATTSGSVNLTGLPSATCFDVYVRRDCGASGTSALVGPVNFCTTQPPCPAPANIGFSNVQPTSATVTFTPAGNSTYLVVYGPTGFNPATGGTTVPAIGGSATLTGLTPATAYQFYVVTICASGQPALAGPTAFTTAICPARTISVFPFTEDFESAMEPAPPCDVAVADANGDGFTWQAFDFATVAHSGSKFMAYIFNDSVTTIGGDDWFFLPRLQLQAGQTYSLKWFHHAVADQGVTFPERLEVKIGAAPTPSAMITTLYPATTITDTTYVQATATQPIQTLVSGIYYVGFHCVSQPDQLALVIDDVTIDRVLGVSDSPLARAVSVFPNPAAGRATVRIEETGARQVSIRVLDALGRVVLTTAAADNATRELDLAGLAQGLYSVQVQLDDVVVTRQLSVQK